MPVENDRDDERVLGAGGLVSRARPSTGPPTDGEAMSVGAENTGRRSLPPIGLFVGEDPKLTVPANDR